ncbi:MAG: prolyl oligopeptidase family serine peptidase [Bryobacteraceae bacterium]|nr:prolyl oligopeptidase family serine peptidase [Bryobacteraceae bacterium]
MRPKAFALALSLTLVLGLRAELPPLIDRELFFGDPEISGAQLSPDGKYITFLRPFEGTRNIWVKGTAEPFTAAKPLTNETKRPIPGYFWSRDSKYVLYVQDQGGDENYNVYAVNPAEAPPAGAPVPKARNLTDAKGVRAAIYAVPESDPDLLYVGINDRDKAWHDLYKVKISTGEKTLLRKNTDRIGSWVFDTKDNLRLAVRSAENGDTEFLRVDPDGFKKIYSCGVFESCYPAQFEKSDKQVYVITNKGDEVDLTMLGLMDPATGAVKKVESDPEHKVDLAVANFSDRTKELIATVYAGERLRVYWKNKEWEANDRWLRSKLPGMEISYPSATKDETLFLVSAASDTEPGETYLFNRKTRKLDLQYRIREKIDRAALAQMKPVYYKSSDGLDIPAYLTLPKGLPAKNLPVVVVPHGGPWGRDTWGYRGMTQFLANRGYAVLQMNFRASTGYGKKFLNAGNLEWGQKMQDDITWGVKYLVGEGIVDPKRVGIMGGSYGGYATLAGVAFTPDLYAAAVSIVGPSNLITLLDSIPPYWEQVRVLFYKRMGDPTTPEGKAQLSRQSPLNSAGKIKTPLLVVQGANDPRVNKAESDRIVIALRDRGFPVSYIVAPDEGHGFARPVNSMAMFAAAEEFLARYLGGRFQADSTPEVAARLKEITVDPKTVVVAKKLDPNSVGAPKPANELKAGLTKFKATILMGTQSINLSVATEIKEEGGLWVIVDNMKTPMGEAVDTTSLEKGSLLFVKRKVVQGPTVVEVAYAGKKMTGTMKAGGQDRPVNVELGGPLFGEGAGGMQVLATLPLDQGYKTAFRNFDLQKSKEKLMQLEVTGSEKVTVPAGEFDAWKVEVTPSDGSAGKSTLWVDKANHQMVKLASVMPEMGGATLTLELE